MQSAVRDIARATGFTKGNLSSHLAKLEEAQYVVIEKTFRGKIPLTVIRLTESGRSAFQDYRKQLDELLRTPAQGKGKRLRQATQEG